MRYLITLTLTALLLLPGMVSAARYAGESFGLGVGGRGLALGGAVIAGPFDATAAYWNPAGMNQLEGRYIGAMHAETFGSLLNHDYLTYINARSNSGDDASTFTAFGFYLYYLGGGGIKITELNSFDRPVVVREESHGDYLLAASLSGKLSQKVDFGLTAKLIYRDIGTESGQGLSLDAGLRMQVKPYASVGLVVTDISTGVIRYAGGSFIDQGDSSFTTEAHYETIYPTVKPGLMLEYYKADFVGRFMTSGDIRFESLGESAQYSAGSISLDTHYGWEIGYLDMVFGRTGFDIGRFTAGGGIDLGNVAVDVAYLHHTDFDETFRVSGAYRF